MSRSIAYLAAPISVGDEVGGFLHADRYWSRRPFDGADAAGLQALGDAIGLVMERTFLRGCLFATPAPEPSRTSGSAGRRNALLSLLTPRESEVAVMIAEGLTNAQIATELVLAEATVKTHIKHILRKLGARHRAEVVAMFLRATD